MNFRKTKKALAAAAIVTAVLTACGHDRLPQHRPSAQTTESRSDSPRLPQTESPETQTASSTWRIDLTSQPDAPRSWDFRLESAGRTAAWAPINTPSVWELAGFGAATYGQQKDRTAESGTYLHRFVVPASWRGRNIELVFDGVLTDTVVRLNGRRLGSHQGGFVPFRFQVDSALRFDSENVLEVEVSEGSADASVERAERDADYWLFGGIYRPVYLLASPATSIRHIAVDARADGSLKLYVRTSPLPENDGYFVSARLLDTAAGPEQYPVLRSDVRRNAAWLEARLDGLEPWSAETPRLYTLVTELRRGQDILHRTERRIGFRTIELRPGAGLFVNGRHVLLKGVNRHSFWPDRGRAVETATDRADASLLRSLHANAVRTAHYPPNEAFLEACDELGLYVIDELPGWHDPYDTRAGRSIAQAMVERDAHHPSIILWANGNEGGWNSLLDPIFSHFDLQGRAVIHPGARFGGIDATHYPSWRKLQLMQRGGSRWQQLRDGSDLLALPTEMLHGLYDGGGGAGLAAYWSAIEASPRALGGFLWSLFDEGLQRFDGSIDTFGNFAPDGVLGPYREEEGSAAALREIWSPLRISEPHFEPQDKVVSFVLSSHWFNRTTAGVQLRWHRVLLPPAGSDERSLLDDRLSIATADLLMPQLAPGGSARVAFSVAATGTPGKASAATAVNHLGFVSPGEAVLLEFSDEVGAPLLDSWIEAPALLAAPPIKSSSSQDSNNVGDRVVLHQGDIEAQFDARNGLLLSWGPRERPVPLSGPRLVSGTKTAPLTWAPSTLRRHSEQASLFFEDASGQSLVWSLGVDALRLDYELAWPEGQTGAPPETAAAALAESWLEGPTVEGLVFSLSGVESSPARWLGRGPFWVWGNRRAGRFGLWRKDPARAKEPFSVHDADSPGGLYDARWLFLEDHGLVVHALSGTALSLGPFAFPDDSRTARAELPLGLGVFHRLPEIGTKFHRAKELRPPTSQKGPRRLSGTILFELLPAPPRAASRRSP